MFQAIRVLILHVTLHALGAKLAAIEGKIFPRLKTNNSVVLYAKLNAALLPAKAAMGFDELLIFRCTEPTRPQAHDAAWDRIHVPILVLQPEVWPLQQSPLRHICRSPQRILGERQILSPAPWADFLIVRSVPHLASDLKRLLDCLQVLNL